MVNQSTSLNNSIKGDYGIIETEADNAGRAKMTLFRKETYLLNQLLRHKAFIIS